MTGNESFRERVPWIVPAAALPLLIVGIVWLIAACAGGNGAATGDTDRAPVLEPAETGLVEGAVPEQPPASTVELRLEVAADSVLGQGSEGEQVSILQQALAQLGFDPGGADGAFGPKTEDAVIAFQRQSGLEPDGLVGPKTAQAINDALTGPSG